jgi:hypothetical protein
MIVPFHDTKCASKASNQASPSSASGFKQGAHASKCERKGRKWLNCFFNHLHGLPVHLLWHFDASRHVAHPRARPVHQKRIHKWFLTQSQKLLDFATSWSMAPSIPWVPAWPLCYLSSLAGALTGKFYHCQWGRALRQHDEACKRIEWTRACWGPFSCMMASQSMSKTGFLITCWRHVHFQFPKNQIQVS